MDEIELMQRIYNLHPAVKEEDRESSNILYQVVKNHLTDDFQDSVDRAYKKTFSEERGTVGGISYLFAVLRKVLIGTRGSVSSLQPDLLSSIMARILRQGQVRALAMDLGSCSSSPLSFSALKGYRYSEVVLCNLPANNRETVGVVPKMCGFKSTMRNPHPYPYLDARREHQRCFRYPVWSKGGEWDA